MGVRKGQDVSLCRGKWSLIADDLIADDLDLVIRAALDNVGLAYMADDKTAIR